MTLKKIIIWAYFIIALLMTLLVASIYFFTQQKIESEYQRNMLSMIETITSSISNETNGLTQWVEAVANDQSVINSFQAGKNQRDAKAREFENQIAGLLRLRLLVPGVSQTDDSQKPHLGYADLELVQNAQSENPQPIIIQIKLPDAHIAIARAVYKDEQLIGTVLASFSTERIKQFIKTLSQQDGTIALFQENNSLSKSGDTAQMESDPSGTIAITGTPWNIRYWTAVPIDYSEILYLGVALLISLFILGLLSVWASKKLHALFANDVTELKKIISDTAQAKKGDTYEFNFSMFYDLTKHSRLLNIRDVTGGAASIEVEITTEEEEEKKLADRADELLRDLDHQFEKADALIDDLDNEDFDLNIKSTEDTGQSAEIEVLPATAVEIPISLPLGTGITGMIDKTLNADYLKNLGRAFGTEVLQAGMTNIVIGVGGSKSSSKAVKVVSSGLLTAGCKVLNLKRVASPVVAFATQFPKDSVGMVVSDSFLPENTCKLKFLYSGRYVSAQLLERINARMSSGDYIEGLGVSATSDTNPEADYIGAIVEDIHIHCNMKVAVVSASKSIRELAGTLFKALGCDVVSIAEPNVPDANTNTDVFDPRKPAHLQQLCETVKAEQADLGIAYDTEGTGLAIVDSSGHIIWSDRVMMVLAADVLQTFPGADILFDSDGLSALAKTVTQYGGKLQAHSTGEDAFSILAINNMPLAGNMNGQFVFADRWLHYPDALYTSARLLEILSVDDESSEEVFSTLPDYTGAQPFFSAINEINALGLLEKWEQKLMQSQGTSLSTDDGLRIEVVNIGWMVVRYEKQQGGLVFRFQATSDEGLQTLMKSFKKLVPNNSGLKLPF